MWARGARTTFEYGSEVWQASISHTFDDNVFVVCFVAGEELYCIIRFAAKTTYSCCMLMTTSTVWRPSSPTG
jgi:hypothetical protein